MLILMITTASGPAGSFEAGHQYNVQKELGLAFVQAGAAVEVKTDSVIPEQAVQASQLTAENMLGPGSKRASKPAKR